MKLSTGIVKKITIVRNPIRKCESIDAIKVHLVFVGLECVDKNAKTHSFVLLERTFSVSYLNPNELGCSSVYQKSMEIDTQRLCVRHTSRYAHVPLIIAVLLISH